MEVAFVAQSQPKFLNIYNTLYKEIQHGKYPGGAALPTEKVLCARFDVSRMTLRQAIKLLVEDGVVESIRGKGHFVTMQKRDGHTTSVSKFEHPLHQVARVPMSLQEVHYRVDLESEYTNDLFPHHPSAVIAMERYYAHTTSTQADALCFTFIPLDVIDTFHINTQKASDMADFVEEIIYQHATQSDLKCTITQNPQFKHEQYTFDGGQNCWLMTESLYGHRESPIMINKWYLPQEHGEIRVTRMREEMMN
ncbi:GntR family transcriptional regulator [Staphylococcus sp. H16/1A]|uniref:GntR family transcriptional regulator n=1 Tax=Staphylococcus canis TaxID=2724942 RepID=A0ABS0T7W4_9STAP|nr:GntR family transcriptional regulator [Staphylococcus canis]MBI5974858.1 GntR family transcriptional regulator [Staphylococcus canis]